MEKNKIKKNKLDSFDKIAFGILIIFVIFIPFHAFLVTFFGKFFPEFVKIFSVWKEILFLILGFLFLGKFVKNFLQNLKKEEGIANKIKNNLVNKFFSTGKNFPENKNFFQKNFSKIKKIFWVSKKSFPIQKFFLFDKIFLGFFLIAILSGIFSIKFGENSFVQAIFGFRLDFIYFILFYLIRGFNFDFSQIKKIFYFFVFSGLISLIFGFSLYSKSFNRVPEKIITSKNNYINLVKNNPEKKEFLEKYYLGNKNSDILFLRKNLSKLGKNDLKNFFENPEQINFRNENFLNLMVDLGYSAGVSNYEVNKALPAFHIVQAKGTARFASTFAGPNQLGFYLMVFIGVILGFLKYLFQNSPHPNPLPRGEGTRGEKIFLISTLIFTLICLYFSFSRSAWLGIILIFGLFTFFSFPQKYRLKIFFGGIILSILIGFYTYLFQSDFFERTILRGGSTSMHIEKTLKGIETVKENQLGLGLGMAGPVTMRFSGENRIAENWFVQIFEEFGILGGIIYLLFIGSFLVFLIRKLLKSNFENFALFGGFLGLSGILFAGLFLHSFEDIGVSFLLFLFLGLGFIFLKKPLT